MDNFTTGSLSLRSKPTDEQIDVYAVSHKGKVRAENQDHFLVGQLKKQMEVHFTSLPEVKELHVTDEHIALDPGFFKPLQDQPLHLAFRTRKGS